MAEKDNCDLNRSGGATSNNPQTLTYDAEFGAVSEEIPKPEALGSTLKEITRSLEILRNKYAEKKIETLVPKKMIENKKVADLLNQVFSKKPKKGLCSKKRRDEIFKMLEENENLSKDVLEILKENRKMEFTIMQKKLYLRETIQKRNKVWKEASEVLKRSTLNFSESGQSNISEMLQDCCDEENQKYEQKELKFSAEGVLGKLHRIKLFARVLYNLITHSKEPWATNEDLLEVVCCTGKLLERDFDKRDLEDLKKLMDDVVHTLDHVKV